MKPASRTHLYILASCGVLALAVVLGCFLVRPARADARAPGAPPMTGRQVWFLNLLKTLADTDGLNDPDKVGAILGVKFSKTVVTTSPSHGEGFGKSFERDEYSPTTTTWFLPGPPGYAYAENFRPNRQSGRAADVDLGANEAVSFKYFQSKRFGLPEQQDLVIWDNLKDDSLVSLIFFGIDKITCVTLQDVRAYFPSIYHMEATDSGEERYLYYAPARENSGAVLTFPVPQGKCISEVSIDDFSSFDKRHARAQYKFFRCVQQAADAFCPEHLGGSFFHEFNAYAREKCVGLSAYYDKEPSTNEDPPEKVDYGKAPTGCPVPH